MDGGSIKDASLVQSATTMTMGRLGFLRAVYPRRAAIGELLSGGTGERNPITVTSDPGLRFRVVDALADLVEELALAGPLVIGVDDLQWADRLLAEQASALGWASIARMWLGDLDGCEATAEEAEAVLRGAGIRRGRRGSRGRRSSAGTACYNDADCTQTGSGAAPARVRMRRGWPVPRLLASPAGVRRRGNPARAAGRCACGPGRGLARAAR